MRGYGKVRIATRSYFLWIVRTRRGRARDAFHNHLDNQSVAVMAWEHLAGRRRYRVRLSGQFANNQPYCHWIDQAAYATMQDTTDYTQPAGR